MSFPHSTDRIATDSMDSEHKFKSSVVEIPWVNMSQQSLQLPKDMKGARHTQGDPIPYLGCRNRHFEMGHALQTASRSLLRGSCSSLRGSSVRQCPGAIDCIGWRNRYAAGSAFDMQGLGNRLHRPGAIDCIGWCNRYAGSAYAGSACEGSAYAGSADAMPCPGRHCSGGS